MAKHDAGRLSTWLACLELAAGLPEFCTNNASIEQLG